MSGAVRVVPANDGAATLLAKAGHYALILVDGERHMRVTLTRDEAKNEFTLRRRVQGWVRLIRATRTLCWQP